MCTRGRLCGRRTPRATPSATLTSWLRARTRNLRFSLSFSSACTLLAEEDHSEARLLLPGHEHCPWVSSSSWRLEDAGARAAPDAWAKDSEARQHACISLRGSFPAEEQVLISRLQALEEQNEACRESLSRVFSGDGNPPGTGLNASSGPARAEHEASPRPRGARPAKSWGKQSKKTSYRVFGLRREQERGRVLVHIEHDEASGGHSLQELHVGEEAKRETRRENPIVDSRFPAEFPGDCSRMEKKELSLSVTGAHLCSHCCCVCLRGLKAGAERGVYCTNSSVSTFVARIGKSQGRHTSRGRRVAAASTNLKLSCRQAEEEEVDMHRHAGCPADLLLDRSADGRRRRDGREAVRWTSVCTEDANPKI